MCGIQSLGILLPHFPQLLVDSVAEFLNDKILHLSQPNFQPKSCLSLEEAVVPEFSLDNGIALTTSAGYPYNVNFNDGLFKGTVKNNYILVERDKHSKIIKIKIDPVLHRVVSQKRELRQKNIVPFTVFWDHLKDERRKREKVYSQGGTRIFSLSPLDFTLDCRSLFVHFRVAFNANWEKLQHCVTIDPDSIHWTYIKKNMDLIHGEYVTIDFKNFGPTLTSQLTPLWYDLACRWYSKYAPDCESRHNIWRKAMALEVVYATHLAHDQLYRVRSGIPSGHPDTTALNTYVHIFLIHLAFKALTQLSLSEFTRYVCLYTYGDDGMMKIHHSILPKFNAITIISYFKRYGIVATDGKKNFLPTTTISLADVTFLKRSFKPHPFLTEIWLAPIDRVSIIDCAHWVWMSNDLEQASAVNAEASVRLCFGHGPDIFEKWKQIINFALAQLGLEPVILSWKEISLENYSGHVFQEACSFDYKALYAFPIVDTFDFYEN